MPSTDSRCKPFTVLVEARALDLFLAAAVTEYELLTPEAPLACFALLLGGLDTAEAEARVQRVVFGRNARTTDPAARREFAEAIVPRFGPAYENEVRGWWLDSRDLLRISQEAEDEGLEVLGSIHMHPDWHRIGPPQERGFTLSEQPTPMDQYVFGGTAWPVNVICYLERRGRAMYHALAAWAPPSADRPGGGCAEVPLRVQTGNPTATTPGEPTKVTV